MGPAQPPALKDPAEMRIVSTSAGGASEERSGRRGRRGHSDPPADYKPPPRPERRVEKPWGAVDLTTREGVALDLLRQAVRQEYADELTDISFYGRAGADARGTSGRFYEIKIASAGLTKTVPFRASQLSRALTMRERFVLVVVSGLLKGSGRAIVLFFPDPLNRLDIARSVDFELTGVTEGREVRRIEFE
jgi:hypothetical protein